jgi:hypothetical protein
MLRRHGVGGLLVRQAASSATSNAQCSDLPADDALARLCQSVLCPCSSRCSNGLLCAATKADAAPDGAPFAVARRGGTVDAICSSLAWPSWARAVGRPARWCGWMQPSSNLKPCSWPCGDATAPRRRRSVFGVRRCSCSTRTAPPRADRSHGHARRRHRAGRGHGRALRRCRAVRAAALPVTTRRGGRRVAAAAWWPKPTSPPLRWLTLRDGALAARVPLHGEAPVLRRFADESAPAAPVLNLLIALVSDVAFVATRPAGLAWRRYAGSGGGSGWTMTCGAS